MTDVHEWTQALFALVDRFDADALGARMAPDGVLISTNAGPVVGREGVREAVRQFERGVASIGHEVVRAWRIDDTVITDLRVTYVRYDGGKVVLPCANIFDLTDDGLIAKYQIFMDMTPVFA